MFCTVIEYKQVVGRGTDLWFVCGRLSVQILYLAATALRYVVDFLTSS